MTKTTKSTDEIHAAIDSFREGWDRQTWMADNGEWASAQWDDEREEYEDARTALVEAVKALPSGDSIGRDQHVLETEVRAELKAVASASLALADQIRPDESDYIAEGLIDPDEAKAKAADLDIGKRWQGWDCTEGWGAYRVGDALYLRWFREACGARHDRDLWVCVDDAFFAQDETEAEAEDIIIDCDSGVSALVSAASVAEAQDAWDRDVARGEAEPGRARWPRPGEARVIAEGREHDYR